MGELLGPGLQPRVTAAGDDGVEHDKMMIARRSSSSPSGFARPEELFDAPYTVDLMGHQREDVTSDGKRFLMVQNSDDFPIVILQNWPKELARLVR